MVKISKQKPKILQKICGTDFLERSVLLLFLQSKSHLQFLVGDRWATNRSFLIVVVKIRGSHNGVFCASS